MWFAKLLMLNMFIYLYLFNVASNTMCVLDLILILGVIWHCSTSVLFNMIKHIFNTYSEYFKVNLSVFQSSNNSCIGGGKANIFTHSELFPSTEKTSMSFSSQYKFLSYILKKDASDLTLVPISNTIVNCPLAKLTEKLSLANLKIIAACHNIFVHSKMS